MTTALQKVKLLTGQLMPFTATLAASPDRTNTITLSSSAFGLLNTNDVITIGESYLRPSAFQFTVKSLIDGTGTSLSLTRNLTFGNSSIPGPSGLFVFKIQPDSFIVGRHGSGNSSTTLLSVTSTADSYVLPTSKGAFRLKLTFGDQEVVGQSCLRYDSMDWEFQNAINALQVDFDGDGVYTRSDWDHVNVTRSGDGSVGSGYGYTYTLRFQGPPLTFGRSEALGNSEPVLEILDDSRYGGCSGLNSTLTESTVQVNYRDNVGRTVWSTLNSTTTQIQPGDYLRLPKSATPYQLYQVQAVSPFAITVDRPMSTFTVPQSNLLNLLVLVGIITSLPYYRSLL